MEHRLTHRNIAAAIALGCAPLVLAVVLNFMRPDLIAPMLDHIFGYVLVATTTVLVMGGVLVQLVAALQTSTGTRIGLSVAAFLLLTLPALGLVLFGPIVFAFMYGAQSGN